MVMIHVPSVYMYGTLRSIHKLCFTDDTLRAHVPICSVQECVESMHSLACELNVKLHMYITHIHVHVQCVHVLSMA